MRQLKEANQKVERVVTGGYKKIEQTVVTGYRKIEDSFVDAFLAEDGETTEEAKERIRRQIEKNRRNES